MKRAMLMVCGGCWLFFGAGCALLLAQYAGELAGWEVFGLGISSGGVLLGMAHITGLFAGMVWCFGVGLLLCVHGLARAECQAGRNQPGQAPG
jgi:hypothetical protein